MVGVVLSLQDDGRAKACIHHQDGAGRPPLPRLPSRLGHGHGGRLALAEGACFVRSLFSSRHRGHHPAALLVSFVGVGVRYCDDVVVVLVFCTSLFRIIGRFQNWRPAGGYVVVLAVLLIEIGGGVAVAFFVTGSVFYFFMSSLVLHFAFLVTVFARPSVRAFCVLLLRLDLPSPLSSYSFRSGVLWLAGCLFFSFFFFSVCPGKHPCDHERPSDLSYETGQVAARQPLPGRRGALELPRGRGCGRGDDGVPHGERFTPLVLVRAIDVVHTRTLSARCVRYIPCDGRCSCNISPLLPCDRRCSRNTPDLRCRPCGRPCSCYLPCDGRLLTSEVPPVVFLAIRQ